MFTKPDQGWAAFGRPRRRVDFAAKIPTQKERTVKGADKPKKLAKKAPQKTLKERRNEKRAAAKNKFGSS